MFKLILELFYVVKVKMNFFGFIVGCNGFCKILMIMLYIENMIIENVLIFYCLF